MLSLWKRYTLQSMRQHTKNTVLPFLLHTDLVVSNNNLERTCTINFTGSQAFRLTLITIPLSLLGLQFADVRSCNLSASVITWADFLQYLLYVIRYKHFLFVQFLLRTQTNILLSQKYSLEFFLAIVTFFIFIYLVCLKYPGLWVFLWYFKVVWIKLDFWVF